MMIQGKSNMKKWFVLVVLVFVMVAAGEVWGINAASAAAKPIKLRMMMAREQDPNQLSPLSSSEGTDKPILPNVMEPLVDVGKKGEPVPKLATKWEHSADLTKWRFNLRKGVKFHNGDNFTAWDVVEVAKWNIEDKKLSRLYDRLPVKEAVAVDDYTVDLIFGEPQPLLLSTIRLMYIPPTAYSRDNRKMSETHPIGTGPYRFVEWNRGRHIKLAKFDGYWGLKPQIDGVEILFRAEEGVRLAALMVGEVDWVYGLSPEQASRAPKTVHMPSPETVWFRFDEYIQEEFGGVSILADKRLRQAVDYAIDRKALVALYQGFATPSQGQFASPGDFGYNPNLKSRPYDLEKAKALVREAGAVGKTLTFVGSADRWSKDREVGEAVAYMIEKTGLKVKLMLMPFAEVRKYKAVRGEDRKFMADIVFVTTDTLLEVETRFPDIFMEDGKFSGTRDPELNRLYKEALAETDYAKRGEKVARSWAYAYEQAHYVPLFKLEWIWGIAKNLEWRIDITGRPNITDMRFID